MGYNAYFQRGNYKIMVDGTDVLALAMDFLPPTTDEEIYTSSGTSANVYGGEIRVGQKARNKAWGFGVRALGTSPGKSGLQMDLALGRLNHFLRGAGDENNPTTFVWYPDNDITFEPVFGQGFRRVVVVSGYAGWGDGYSIANLRESGVNNCPVTLQIKPYALGRSQVVGTAAGGVYEDTLGYADGISRGVWIPPASAAGGNYFTNPVFGDATWNTGWTAGAGLRAEQNTDKEYLLFGTSSARIMRTAATSTYTQSLTLTVHTYCISCYAKKRDGSAVTSSDLVMWYNASDLSTTVQTLTNGWYRLYATVTGIASAHTVGVDAKITGNSIYVDGFQIERLAYPTPFYYGDMLGCAWASTAHASASSRVAASISWTQANAGINAAEGTLELVVDTRNIIAASSSYLWQWYVAADNTLLLYFSDATTLYLGYYNGTAYNTYGTVAAGKLVIHATWSQAGTKLFVNGAQLGSTQTGTNFLALTGGTVYLGGYGATAETNAVYRQYAIYDRAMTAAQITARYNHFAPLVTTDKPLMPIPWGWTIGGDGVYDQYTDATHADYGVVGGIPGDAPADTIYDVTFSSTTHGFVLSNLITKDYHGSLFMDGSAVGVTTAGAYLPSSSTGISIYQEFAGKNLYLFAPLQDADQGDLVGKISLVTASAFLYNAEVPIGAVGANLLNFLIGPINIPGETASTLLPSYFGKLGATLLLNLYFDRLVDGDGNVTADFLRIMSADNICRYAANVTVASLRLHNRDVTEYISSAWEAGGNIIGKPIEVAPNQLNMLIFCNNNVGGVVYAATTTTIGLTITPRWSLL